MIESDIAKRSFAAAVKPGRFSDSPLERLVTSHDLAPMPKVACLAFKMMPDVVVRPKEPEEVAEIVRIANSWGWPVTPRGAASWGFGGAVPNKGGVTVDLASMDRIIGLDVERGIVRVQPGVVWLRLDEWLNRRGYFVPYYPSSAPGATVGGWISTGGVGVGSYKYGTARDNVRSLQVVLPSGQMINTAHLLDGRHPSQFDLTCLFVGAEGSLGIVTTIDLQVYPKPESFVPTTYSFPDMDHVFNALVQISQARLKPYHVAFVDGNYFRFLRAMGREAIETGGVVNLVFEGPKAKVDEEIRYFDALMTAMGGVRMSDEVAQHEWKERSYELRSKKLGTGAVIGEALVPVDKALLVTHDMLKLVRKMKMNVSVMGYLIDRSTVAFLPFYLTDERRWIKALSSLSFVKKFLDISNKYGGRGVGLGLFMANNIYKMRDRNTIELLKKIKETIDPEGRINGGKTTMLQLRYGIKVGPRLFRFGMNALALLKRLYPRDRYDRPVPGGFTGGEHE